MPLNCEAAARPSRRAARHAQPQCELRCVQSQAATRDAASLSRSRAKGQRRGGTARKCFERSRITAASVSTFGQELFRYITTVIPYWRVCDEGWPLANDYLTGIGVLRNYGGQVMVLPWNEDARSQLTRFRELLEPLLKRIVVVVDDREPEDLQAISAVLAPIAVLPWSRRAELASFIIKDTSDSG